MGHGDRDYSDCFRTCDDCGQRGKFNPPDIFSVKTIVELTPNENYCPKPGEIRETQRTIRLTMEKFQVYRPPFGWTIASFRIGNQT